MHRIAPLLASGLLVSAILTMTGSSFVMPGGDRVSIVVITPPHGDRPILGRSSSVHRLSYYPPSSSSTTTSTTSLATSITTSDDDDDPTNERVASVVPDVTGVTLKMAFDSSDAWGVADGMMISTTTLGKSSYRFTSSSSLDMVHRLRNASDAVLVGRVTVMRDDCSLTVRRGVDLGGPDGRRQPVRVVIDPSLTLMDDDGGGGGGGYAVLNDGFSTIVYHRGTTIARSRAAATTPREHVTLVELIRPHDDIDNIEDDDDDDDDDGKYSSRISPSDVLKDLSSRGLRHVMVEGGPATARAFLEERIVDRAILVRAPMKFDMPVPANMDRNTLTMAGLVMIGTTASGGDTIEHWTLNGSPWPTPQLHQWP
ncbi:hypothetical protein ACHAXA_002959 [Cyclostephanos tholiformis]|uniref:Bacterial bifunctional deaminase-reductase C-terminal domain-containing protein n=1 Tax=Cyclostephanos tholiformis TaxID=382380 RepID=A0ABD3RXU5_9STRA